MKITKSQLRKMIKEELSLIMEEEADMSVEGAVKRAQGLYREFTTKGFGKFSRYKLQDLYNDLQDIKTKHSKEKGEDEGYETLMKLEKVVDEMDEAARHKRLSLIDKARVPRIYRGPEYVGTPTDPHMSWLMSQ